MDEAHHLAWTPESASPRYTLVEQLATATPGVFVWVVLRDDRGGVTWQGYRFEVS